MHLFSSSYFRQECGWFCNSGKEEQWSAPMTERCCIYMWRRLPKQRLKRRGGWWWGRWRYVWTICEYLNERGHIGKVVYSQTLGEYIVYAQKNHKKYIMDFFNSAVISCVQCVVLEWCCVSVSKRTRALFIAAKKYEPDRVRVIVLGTVDGFGFKYTYIFASFFFARSHIVAKFKYFSFYAYFSTMEIFPPFFVVVGAWISSPSAFYGLPFNIQVYIYMYIMHTYSEHQRTRKEEQQNYIHTLRGHMRRSWEWEFSRFVHSTALRERWMDRIPLEY